MRENIGSSLFMRLSVTQLDGEQRTAQGVVGCANHRAAAGATTPPPTPRHAPPRRRPVSVSVLLPDRSRQPQAAASAQLLGGKQQYPAPPGPAGASYVNVYGWIKCYPDAIVRPNSTEQLAAAVRQLRAAAAAAGKQMRLRVSRSRFHGTPSFVCPGAYGGGEGSTIPYTQPYKVAAAAAAAPTTSAAAPSTVAVLIDDLTEVLSVDRSTYQITVQAGLRIDQLLKWADANQMSIDRGAISSYAELSIAGVLATGGHGTGHNVTCNFVRRRGGGMEGAQRRAARGRREGARGGGWREGVCAWAWRGGGAERGGAAGPPPGPRADALARRGPLNTALKSARVPRPPAGGRHDQYHLGGPVRRGAHQHARQPRGPCAVWRRRPPRHHHRCGAAGTRAPPAAAGPVRAARLLP